MHTQSVDHWQHSHVFLGDRHERNERKTRVVIGLTAAMMVAEIVGGTMFGSMALVADGWHMSTHAAALAISALAYLYARRHKNDRRFAFGTGKLGDLAGFTSAIVLALIAVLICYDAVARLLAPVPIAFGEAIAVATVGLCVNLLSAWLLRDDGHHHLPAHDHHHNHDHDHGHRDNNLRSAYVHVIADAATSVLAIVGLLAGALYGWVWMDAVMGIVGAIVIVNWAFTLIRDAGRVLLDVAPGDDLVGEIRRRLESNQDRVSDLHVWQVGPGHYSAIVSVVSHEARTPSFYKARLVGLSSLSHVTIEVQSCDDPSTVALAG
jgi:cation diffusion facilitator family transporter